MKGGVEEGWRGIGGVGLSRVKEDEGGDYSLGNEKILECNLQPAWREFAVQEDEEKKLEEDLVLKEEEEEEEGEEEMEEKEEEEVE